MLSPLKGLRKSSRILGPEDYAKIKHDFIKTYGYELWKTIPLGEEFFELLRILLKEVQNQEILRLSTLKHYGVKNPK